MKNVLQSQTHKNLLADFVRKPNMTLMLDDDHFTNEIIKGRIKDIREFYGLQRTTIAKLLGTSYRQYVRYEEGNSTMPAPIIIYIAVFYNLSLDFVMGMTNEPSIIYNGDYMDFAFYNLETAIKKDNPRFAFEIIDK